MSPSTGTGCWGYVNVTPSGTDERSITDQLLRTGQILQYVDHDDALCPIQHSSQ